MKICITQARLVENYTNFSVLCSFYSRIRTRKNMWLMLTVSMAFAVTASWAGNPVFMAECGQKLNVNVDEIAGAFMKNGYLANENDQNAKCWFSCLAEKENSIDSNGNIVVPRMLDMIAPKYASKMKPEEISALFQKCAVRSENDTCEKVYQFHKCHMTAFLSKS